MPKNTINQPLATENLQKAFKTSKSIENRRFDEIQLENDYSVFTIPKNTKEPEFMLNSLQ